MNGWSKILNVHFCYLRQLLPQLIAYLCRRLSVTDDIAGHPIPKSFSSVFTVKILIKQLKNINFAFDIRSKCNKLQQDWWFINNHS